KAAVRERIIRRETVAQIPGVVPCGRRPVQRQPDQRRAGKYCPHKARENGQRSWAPPAGQHQMHATLYPCGEMFLLFFAAASLLYAADADWRAYGGGPAGTRSSPLKQITRVNVVRLHVAWTYDTADGPGDPQTQPILVNGVLYGVTPTHKVIAL